MTSESMIGTWYVSAIHRTSVTKQAVDLAVQTVKIVAEAAVIVGLFGTLVCIGSPKLEIFAVADKGYLASEIRIFN